LGTWIPISNVLRLKTDLLLEDFTRYARNIPHGTVVDRGCEVYILKRKVTAIRVIDRELHRREGTSPPELQILQWDEFLVNYKQNYLRDRASFESFVLLAGCTRER